MAKKERKIVVLGVLLTAFIRKTFIHYSHVRLFCRQNLAPCRQELVAWRSSFNKGLKKEDTESIRVAPYVDAFDLLTSLSQTHLNAFVTLQAVVGSHHHIPLPPLSGVIKVKDTFLI